MKYQQDTYMLGLHLEAQTISILKRDLPEEDIRKATPEEDYEHDIDVWIGEVPVSIKHQLANTGNFAFELEVQVNGEYKPSWFFNSKAKLLLCVSKGRHYFINLERLRQYTKSFGWPDVKHLKRSTTASQQNIGHPHTNAIIGLMSIEELAELSLVSRHFHEACH